MPVMLAAAAASFTAAVTTVATAAGTFLTTLGVSASIAGAVSSGIMALGGAQGLFAAANAWANVASVVNMIRKPKLEGMGPSPIDFKADTNAHLPFILGRFGTGGNIVFAQTAGNKNNFLSYYTVLSAGGPAESIESFRVNDTVVTFNAGGERDAIGHYNDRMWQVQSLGSETQTYLHHTGTGGKFTPGEHGGNPPEWTANHRLRGMTSTMWTMFVDTTKYANGTPRPMWVVNNGIKVTDPRTGEKVYTKNPYCHAYQFLLGYWVVDDNDDPRRIGGVGLPPAAIDIAAYIDGANVADANEWEVSGQIHTGMPKWNTLAAILAAGGGVPLHRGHLISCMVQAPRVSIATIEERHLLQQATVDAGALKRERKNALIPRFRSETNRWAIVPGTKIVNDNYVEEDGEERSTEMTLDLVTKPVQVGQLTAYALADGREDLVAVVTVGPEFFNIRAGSAITVNIPKNGLVNRKMIVTKRRFDPKTFLLTFTLRSETDSKHEWALGRSTEPPETPALEGIDDSLVPPPNPDVWNVTAPTVTQPGGGRLPVIRVSLDDDMDGVIDDPNAISVLIDYRPVDEEDEPLGEWQTFEAPLALIIDVPVEANVRYEVVIRYRYPRNQENPETGTDPVIVTTPPVVSNDTQNVGPRSSVELNELVDDLGVAMGDAEEAISEVASDLADAEAALSAATAAVDERVTAARAALSQATQRLYAEMGRARIGILSEQEVRIEEMSVQITRIDGLLVRMDDAEGGIEAAEALIATLESVTIDLENPSSLASQIEVISSSLDTIEGDLLAQISTIEETLVEQAADLSDLAGDLVILDGALIDAAEAIDDLDGQMVAVTGRTDALEASVEDLEDEAASTAASLTTVQQVVSTQGAAGVYRSQLALARSARGKVATLSETLIRITETTAVYEALDLVELTLTGEVDDLGGDLVTLTGVVGGHTTLIADLDEAKVETSDFDILTATVSGLAGGLDGVDGRLTTAEGTITSHTSLISGLGLDLSDLGDSLTLLALDVDDHDNRLDDVEGEAAAIATQVDGISASVDTLEGRADDTDDALDDLDGRQTASEAGLLTVTQAAATEASAGLYRAQHAYARTARGRASVLSESLLRVTDTAAVYTALDAVELEIGDDLTDLGALVASNTDAILDLEEGTVSLSAFDTLSGEVDSLDGVVSGHSTRLDDIELAAEGYASATSVDDLGVVVDDISADLTVVAGAVVDVESQLQAAFFEIVAAAGGDPAHLAIKADETGSMIALSATALFLKSVVGDDIIEALKIVGGEAYFGAPISVDVSGRRFSIGPGFGVSGSECMLWFGPDTTALADMSRTNGYYSFGTDGAMYKGTAVLGALASRNDIDASYVINEGITKEWRLDSQPVVSFTGSGAMTTRTTMFSMTLTAAGKKITFDGKYLLGARHSQDAWNLYVVVERTAGATTVDVFNSKRPALAINGDGYISDWQHISFTDTPPVGSVTYTIRIYHDYTIGSPGGFVNYDVSNKILSAREHKTES